MVAPASGALLEGAPRGGHQRRVREELVRGLGDERRGEQRDLVRLGVDGGVAEQDRVAGRPLRRDREVRVDRRADPADVGHVRAAGFSSSPWSAMPYAAMLARKRSARTGLLFIVEARPENVTSTVVPVAVAAASHSARNRSRMVS